MAKFDITAAFAAAVGNVSDSDTSREAIEYIGLDKLEADPGNFYSLTGLEDLAANIELCGLQQPIRVRPTEDGRYVIVSGHRRWSALKLLRGTEGSGDRWASIPCIVERDEASQELRELRLILANSSTRVLSPAEVSKQAQRVELLLYQLKEQGYEFPGRMRDQVAAACQVSAPKLARLKVIRERLIPRPRPPGRCSGTRQRPGKPNAKRRSRRKSGRMCSSGPRGLPQQPMPLGWTIIPPSTSQTMAGA